MEETREEKMEEVRVFWEGYINGFLTGGIKKLGNYNYVSSSRQPGHDYVQKMREAYEIGHKAGANDVLQISPFEVYRKEIQVQKMKETTRDYKISNTICKLMNFRGALLMVKTHGKRILDKNHKLVTVAYPGFEDVISDKLEVMMNLWYDIKVQINDLYKTEIGLCEYEADNAIREWSSTNWDEASCEWWDAKAKALLKALRGLEHDTRRMD